MIRLADYQAPSYTVTHTDLTFDLHPSATQVTARLQLKRQGESNEFQLDGVGLTLKKIAIDGVPLAVSRYTYDGKVLALTGLPEACELFTVVEINPSANTALEGLYLSNGMFCTQCEAEGFRRITFFPDRPDVLSRYTVTLKASKAQYPQLLSNGNPVAQGEEGEQHWATWEDPFPKPSYLFAVVAGDLACLDSTYTTRDGREVRLEIYAEPRDLPKLEHAMNSLKAAMAWDEKVYGLSYDLDLYMVVAVSHFNLGAMENKGLNIFNTACVLAHPNTTTDQGFERVEAVIGHEYFHNWSGNRVTLRDWFQLSLKEGLTVFREQHFCEDQNDAAVKRVEDVKLLKAMQFPEDQGPLAHPVRPESYKDIDNFYTATTYEKGAELVRMQWQLLGEKAFLQGAHLFFTRFDGQAVTVEDFLACMEEASGRSLQQFKRWYTQAGTPRLTVTDSFANGTYTLTVKQHTPPTPGQDEKAPQLIPLRFVLLDEEGTALPLNAEGETETVWELTEQEQTMRWSLEAKPTPSLLRGFSAPVELEYAYSTEQLARLVTHDTDGYVRWQAAQHLYLQALVGEASAELVDMIAKVMAKVLSQAQGREALAALLLTLPSVKETAATLQQVDYAALQQRRESLQASLGHRLQAQWQACVLAHKPAPYKPLAADIGCRSLENVALGYLSAVKIGEIDTQLRSIYFEADNMTRRSNALRLLWHYDAEDAEQLLAHAYQAALDEPLVMDLWFQLQATKPTSHTVERVAELLKHQQFEWTSPNRVRALLGQFAQHNPVAFHREDGAGYRLWCQGLAHLDTLNPQMAARLLGSVMDWRKLAMPLQVLLKAELKQWQNQGLSPQSAEVMEQLFA